MYDDMYRIRGRGDAQLLVGQAGENVQHDVLRHFIHEGPSDDQLMELADEEVEANLHPSSHIRMHRPERCPFIIPLLYH